MDRIWRRRRNASQVREVFDELAAERNIAYTTVMSTMDNLHTKGWLARERAGKAYRYSPTLSREQHSARLMREALDGGGQPDWCCTTSWNRSVPRNPPGCVKPCAGWRSGRIGHEYSGWPASLQPGGASPARRCFAR